jgi:hypothetical protein
VLHVGVDPPADPPADVPTISEVFTADHLRMAVTALMPLQPAT